uniref:Cilia- and flagella-associated protein 410 n=1 Tax=Phallusia mammillata TaxID=59560 RepID=A0A6F9D9R1_9ASCI|nr:protein C21orf2 homolog [Phallusia mammillata]
MVVLSEKTVLARSRAKDLSGVKNLNCWGANISDTGVLEKIPNVEVINFSANSIEGLDTFANCTYLKELYLRKNKLDSIDEVLHLKELKHLKLLWLSGNPFCDKQSDEDYRLSVLKILPHLHKLDDKTVTDEELVKALALTIDERNSGLSEEEAQTDEQSPGEDRNSDVQHGGEIKEETNSNPEPGEDDKQLSDKNEGEPSKEANPIQIPVNDEESASLSAPSDPATSNDDDKPDPHLPVQLCKDESEEKFPEDTEAKNSIKTTNSTTENFNQCEKTVNQSNPEIADSESPASSSAVEEQVPTSSRLLPDRIYESGLGDAPEGTSSSAVQMSLDETNQLRVQLGLKPLSAAKYEISVSPLRKTVAVKKTRKMKKSTRNNLLTATLSLVAELDEESLLIVQEAIQEQLDQQVDENEQIFYSTSDSVQQVEEKSFQKKIVDMLGPG